MWNWKIWLGMTALLAACATVALSDRSPPAPNHNSNPIETAPTTPPPAPWQPQVPAITWDHTFMEPVGRRTPPFPFLPGEDATSSRSVGDVTTGFLVNAVPIDTPHPHLAFLPRQWNRHLHYTSDEMFTLVSRAAAYVAEKHEGSIVWLGNFSALGGGNIPWSVSHNSGRDADIAFFVLDPDGNPAHPRDLLPMNDEGFWEGEDPDDRLYFDVARNWTLVEGLIATDADSIQFIFVSNPLRSMLLAHAREIRADTTVIRRATQMLLQPGGALPHNDHFHIRLYCSPKDVEAGCEDSGRRAPWFTGHAEARVRGIERGLQALQDSDGHTRSLGVRRLALMNARQHTRTIESLLDDEDPRVRTAVARALGQFGAGAASIVARLEIEEDPRVVAELIKAGADIGGTTIVRSLIGLLASPKEVEFATLVTDLRTIVADALVAVEDGRAVGPLIDAMATADANVFLRLENAARILTNYDPTIEAMVADAHLRGAHAANAIRSQIRGEDLEPMPPLPSRLSQEERLEKWNAWYRTNRQQTRDRWLALGFQNYGYNVPDIHVRHVWEIARAIRDHDHLSYNAQRILMRLASWEAPSLEWSKFDASWYWRRWFERRCQRYGCPPPPEDMSTLR